MLRLDRIPNLASAPFSPTFAVRPLKAPKFGVVKKGGETVKKFGIGVTKWVKKKNVKTAVCSQLGLVFCECELFHKKKLTHDAPMIHKNYCGVCGPWPANPQVWLLVSPHHAWQLLTHP